MKALLIDPETQEIQPIEVNSLDDIRAAVGQQTIESDAVGEDGDRLFFDEECFIRGTTGRFQIDRLIPVAGKGVVVGAPSTDGPLNDVRVTAEALSGRTVFQ